MSPSSKTGIVLPLFLALTMMVNGRFYVEKSSVTVLNSWEMGAKHDAAIADFGIPNHGGFMIGSVVYAGQDAYGCNSFNKTFKPKSFYPTILLIDRGVCNFVLKIWNGQESGVTAVLIADDIVETLIAMDSPEEIAQVEA